MDSLSAPIRRGPIPWQGLLLTVSLLNFCCLPTTAQNGMVSINAAEGQDVILRVPNMPPNVRVLVWYTGGWYFFKYHTVASAFLPLQTIWPAYRGRRVIKFDGSLMIWRVTKEDAGIYLVEFDNTRNRIDRGLVQLNVYEPVRVPTLQASNTKVMEHKDSVVLTCYTKAVSVQWFFNGMNLQLMERMKLSWSNSTLKIDSVRREDAGKYHCEVSNPISSAKSVQVELDVKY